MFNTLSAVPISLDFPLSRQRSARCRLTTPRDAEGQHFTGPKSINRRLLYFTVWFEVLAVRMGHSMPMYTIYKHKIMGRGMPEWPKIEHQETISRKKPREYKGSVQQREFSFIFFEKVLLPIN